ncbi:cytochrome P450 [Aspergillus steynii IBT 23096]|uniref:Cytochrome P450 n=1 Tax=Aspergillus steynii IBT 23096 TaxID=1392250 RepID=A0A2I2GPT2_9EURO|nr:cytochrome P450 [Aspergillus steynii IBT 23096]PLB54879.1 cytochrome P450 [Aspergillus steynii IBT 23096]
MTNEQCLDCLLASVQGHDVPHSLPYTIPLLRNTFGFINGGSAFFYKAVKYCEGRRPLRIDLLADEIYLVQHPGEITRIFNTAGLTVTKAYAIALKYCFGMSDRAVEVYLSDTSGSRERPIPGSNVPETARVSYHTHRNLVEGLLGDGLEPTTKRIKDALFASLGGLAEGANPHSGEWVYGDDLSQFFEEHLGSSMLRGLFGSLLLTDSPDFTRNLWDYDKRIMQLAKRLPRFLIPRAYKLRNELIASIMRWHQLATILSWPEADEEKEISLWGSTMMRRRHAMLLKTEGQDLRSVASTDLGLIWASVTNIVPSTMILCTQMYRDLSVLKEVRQSCGGHGARQSPLDIDIKSLEKHPILLSLYAESLRFGVQIHIPRSSPHKDLQIGGQSVPKRKMILINTWLSHINDSVWNTRDGLHPLDTFWPRRFLVNPGDDGSGPTKRHNPGVDSQLNTEASRKPVPETFSLEGLDGVWIPYGGGQHACPGRILAKRIMLLTAAMIATMFDIELLGPESALEFVSPRFGFGVKKPAKKVPFRIRRRR